MPKNKVVFNMKRNLIILAFTAVLSSANAQIDNSTLSSRSKVDWTTRKFISSITLDTEKAGISLPNGRNSAESLIKIKTPALLKDPVLSLYVDSANYLGDMIVEDTITLEQVTNIVEEAKQTPPLFSEDGKTADTTNTIDMKNIGKLLVRHKYPYTPEEPIDIVSSRAYSGIIIDARGALPVHGEYISSEIFPAFFPTIWDEEMNIVYEKNIAEKDIVSEEGLVHYDWQDNFSLYKDRIGGDPLYIRAYKVYGRNRTDPIIRRKDALKIITVEENRKLLSQGKIVVLLDKKNLVYDVKLPEKTPEYYASYKQIKKYMYENKVPDINVEDSLTGILFSVDLKFIPDSPELLPAEAPRIRKIAEMLEEIIKDNEFSILVEGHCADIGKPLGQMNLSIERTRTVMKALVNEGIPERIFTYKGYGATRPIASNATEAGRAQNRRVDITARPKATYIQRDW